MDKYVYTYSDPELQRKLAELTKKGVRWKDPVQRYKGLGEMDADQLAETTMDPRHRTLRRITVDDAEAAAEVFELLMGTEVAPRKDFLVAGRLRGRRRRRSTPDASGAAQPWRSGPAFVGVIWMITRRSRSMPARYSSQSSASPLMPR